MHVGYLNFALADQDLALGMPASKRLASGRYEVTFRHRPAGPAKSVALVGTFTDWKGRPLAMTGPDAQGDYSTTIVLGFSASTAFSTSFVAANEGIFRKHGLDVEMKLVPNSSTTPAALVAAVVIKAV